MGARLINRERGEFIHISVCVSLGKQLQDKLIQDLSRTIII